MSSITITATSNTNDAADNVSAGTLVWSIISQNQDSHHQEGVTTVKSNSKRGRKRGARNWKNEDLHYLINFIDAGLPMGRKQWEKVSVAIFCENNIWMRSEDS